MVTNSHRVRSRSGSRGSRDRRRAPNEPVAVLFVNAPNQPTLGADTWIHTQVMKWLDRRRHRVVVACATGSEADPTPTYDVVRDIPDLQVVPVDFTRIGRAALSFLKLVRVVRREGISVVYTSDRPRDAVASVLVARLCRVPCIIHVHVAYSTWMGRPLRWALRRADAIISISAFVSRTVADAGHRPERLHVVPNAIDVRAWTPGVGRAETRRAIGVPASAPTVLSVCRLFAPKGPVELVEACSSLRSEFPDLRLVFAGTDVTPGQTFSAELRKLIAERGMEDAVAFIGWHREIAHLMAACDVYAMQSFEEPFGLVFLEAMAMRRPVVALDDGGTPEVVRHGCDGLLSPPRDHERLVANLGALLRDPALRDAMGARGRARVADEFDSPRMVADVADVFSRVLAGRPPRRHHVVSMTDQTQEVTRDRDPARPEPAALS